MKTADLAWMAGILDLKGRVYVKSNQSRITPQVTLSVDSREPAIIRKMGAMTGTSPDMTKGRKFNEFLRRGCTEHCPDGHVHVDGHATVSDMGRWTVTGAAMVVVLTNLEPFLQVKRGYADWIEGINQDPGFNRQGSGMILDSLQRLLNLGWNLPVSYGVALNERLQQGPLSSTDRAPRS